MVGIGIGDRGRSCKEHNTCGHILYPDALVRFIKEEVMVEGWIEVVIAVYWVTDSIEHCRVGFLPRFLSHVQVTEVFDESHSSAIIRKKVYHNHGYCHTTILSSKSNI